MTTVKISDFITIGEKKIYYEMAGEGETLVLGHAGFVDSRMWNDQWEVFAKHFRVIRFDMCGYGQSDPATEPILRYEELLQVLTQLEVEQAHFIGCSLSGEAVLDFALEYPEKVLSLVIVNSAPSGFKTQGDPPPYMMEMIEALQQGEVERASELQIRIWIDGMYREANEVDSDIRERASEMNLIAVRNNTWFIADMQSAPLDPPAITRLDEVECPVLAIIGGLDHPEIHRAIDMIVAGIDKAQKAVITESAHLPNMEKPTEFNELVLNFLNVDRQ